MGFDTHFDQLTINDVDECLIRREESMASGEQVAFEHAFKRSVR